MTQRDQIERQEARARMAAAGIDYVQVKAWAIASGRWHDVELSALNPDAVDAYIAHLKSLAAPEPAPVLVEPPPSRFDPIFADPEFWSDLAGQCAVYRPHAPASFGEALALLEKGARLFLAAVDGAT